ncbi:TRAP transporter substrate-binding protein DctP [Desulfohalobium retbaense]|uniref:Extracellular solute-binding protein n=1 Tax=Desulfohalobium retbaense (strain ATCC 49708 / DSM 5692 / JCM 16813 / HR100) TaxID=485915 RepID=C8WZA0_DESRD|nr:TRAP transporter substrate-binding protein DctP [Desulfohalobium retbaense]ACV67375.1 Extracellular solute-binding protein [Desulfohalobium retbaense DSM 5692]
MKKALWTVFIVGLALSLCTAAQARTWKVSHVRPQDTAIDKDLNAFVQDVDEATNGKINIKVYAASSLGDYTVVQERVGLGAVEMACQPPATGADKRFQIQYFPYLVKNYDQAKKNFGPDGPLRKEIGKLYGEQGIELLAAWPVYFGGIALKEEPKNPGDPTAKKGLKVRVPPMKTFQMLANNIGYMATPLPFSEAFTAVQTGVVDGVIGSGAEGYYASFRDVTNYYVPMNTHFEVWYLIANERMVEGLDKDEMAGLKAAAQRFEENRWDQVVEDQKKNEQRLADYGAEIIEITPEDLTKTAEIVRENVWPEILSDVGTEWGQSVLDNIKE